MRQPDWTRILTILGVILASIAILYIGASVLFRFTSAILLFVMGGIVAYVLTPAVNRLERFFRARWAAIVVAYSMVAVALFAVGVLLFTPFVQQSQSLVDNLRDPAKSSLRTITVVETQAKAIHTALADMRAQVTETHRLTEFDRQQLQAEITALSRDVTNLRKGTISGVLRDKRPPVKQVPGRSPPNPEPQTQVPQSYVTPISTQVDRLQAAANALIARNGRVDLGQYNAALKHSASAASAARRMFHVMSTTPILLIRSQGWLDQRGIRVDVQQKFGQAASQISNSGTDVLDNVITIVTETANLLLNIALILIIAFYFLNDAGKLIHSGLRVVPERFRENAWFFISSLDEVLGGYIRGQLFLSALAGVLGGAGAAALGVPYPLLIGIVTFLLQSVPVIGPMVAVVPAVLISLFFTPPLTTALLFVWFLIFQQIVTNIIGPRVNSMAVGIHPLEAILAVLVGYPLGGLLGAFLAVPIAGIMHIVIREFYAYFALGRSLPTAVVPTEPLLTDPEAATEPGDVARPRIINPSDSTRPLKGPNSGRAIGGP